MKQRSYYLIWKEEFVQGYRGGTKLKDKKTKSKKFSIPGRLRMEFGWHRTGRYITELDDVIHGFKVTYEIGREDYKVKMRTKVIPLPEHVHRVKLSRRGK